LLSLMSKLS